MARILMQPDQIGIWHNDEKGGVRIHAISCNVVRVINGGTRVAVRTQPELDGMIERGYKVTFCRCTKHKVVGKSPTSRS